MKHMPVVILLLFVSSTTFSQTEKGTKMIGVNTNLSYRTVEVDAARNLSTFNLFLKGGYFINNNDVIGFNFGYQTFKQTGFQDEKIASYGLFARHYFFSVIFAGAGFNSVKHEDLDHYNTIPVEVGYATFIRDVVSIEPSITYEVGVSDNASNAFSFLIGFGIYLK